MTKATGNSAQAARILAYARWAAILSAVLLLIAGPSYRFRLLSFDVAVKGPLLVGVIAAITALLLASGVLLTRRAGRSQPGSWRNWLALLFGALVVLSAAHSYGRLRAAPLLHDVTTDTKTPPPFVESAVRRAADHATNPVEYTADYEVDSASIHAPTLQAEAYPDIKAMMLRLKPAEAFAAAEKAAREMNWEIVAVVANEGRIEATVTSPYFGLKDDIAIRVRAERNGRGSIVDVRSSSRIGANDGGANARHIRDYAQRLQSSR